MRLNYEITLSDGTKVGVYDENVQSGILTSYVGPFPDSNSAKAYVYNYTDSWRLGYNGWAKISEIEGKIYARCTRWTSCD